MAVAQINFAKVGFMTEKTLSPGLKLATDIGPLLIFGAVYYFYDITRATIAIVIATLVALAFAYSVEKKIARMPAISGLIVTVFGGMAVLLNDPKFFYIKPTIVSCLFAGILLVGVAMKKPLLKMLFEDALELQDEGWAKLTWRWIFFFIATAILNEIVWRNFEESVWVSYKVFGVLPLTFLFTLAQAPLIMKYQLPEEDTADSSPADS